MGFELPPKSKSLVLDSEIANEGEKVVLSDGEPITFNPPPKRLVVPDWSEIKSLRHYFNRQGYSPYPAWIYHPTKQPVIVKNKNEAAEYGVCYRKTTADERARFGADAVWDWEPDSEWRSNPYQAINFDPTKPGQGKIYVATPPNPVIAQNELIRDLLPLVTSAVVSALKAGGAPSAPANVDPKEWDEFVQFQAWKQSEKAVAALAQDEPDEDSLDVEPNANALFRELGNELAQWKEEAERKGIKVDGRWSLERLKAEVQKAA